MLRTLLAMMGSGRLVVNINVGAQNNYVANTAKVTGYVAGNTDVTFTLTGLVGSASTGSYAFDVDTSWAAGDTVKVVNSGSYIQGRGGAAASAGGPALRAQRACSVDNTGGTISGGGGGGGTGQNGETWSGYPLTQYFCSGGAGGTGAGNGSGASGGSVGSDIQCGYGGAGGALGSSGATGTNVTGGWSPNGGPWAGGAAGAAVNGNSNITWINTGTRNGGIS